MNTLDLQASDLAARARALTPDASFIVQAPAGSGKTEMLIQRILVLLSRVDRPEEILAMTFTKKAAFEMRTRLLQALQKASQPEPSSAHAKLTWQLANAVLKRDQDCEWQLLQNPNQLRILTIDALCVFINKNLPISANFGALPPITNDAALIYTETVQAILAQIDTDQPWSNALQRLLLHQDNDLNKLQQLFTNMLAKRDQWLAHIQFDLSAEHIRTTLESHLQLMITTQLQTLHASMPTHLRSELAAIAIFTNLLAEHQLPAPEANQLSIWQQLANLLMTQSGTWRKRLDKTIGFPALTSLKNAAEKETHLAYRERYNALIKAFEEISGLQTLWSDLFSLPPANYTPAQWSVLSDIFTVLKVLANELRNTFKQHGSIDYIENTQAALTALGENGSINNTSAAFAYAIKHILIDEFQDTAYVQFQLLKKLTADWQRDDGKTLFVVGDPMQSIYRFREAEVGLFIRMFTHGMDNINLQPLALAQNFRSASTIVDWNNQLFNTLFPRENDIALGAVRYSNSISPFADQQNKLAYTELNGYEANDGEAQAQAIVDKILQLQINAPADNIAILVRSRSHLTTIVPALKLANIPFAAIDIDPLLTQSAIQDLFALTCALLHPADRIAWLSVLRAPWCGLSLADLYIIAQDPQVLILESIAAQLNNTNLSADGRMRLARIYPILENQSHLRARQALRTWIENTWLALGGPAGLSSENLLADIKNYFQLLADLEQQEKIINKQKINSRLQHLFANCPTPDAKLRIMTIHSSKGLEFDTVILPHLERKNPPDDKAIFAWMEQPAADGNMGLLLAPLAAAGEEDGALYNYIRRQQKTKLTLETDRLLYVAATRAKKRLLLLFNLKKNSAGEIKSEASSFLDKLWPAIKNNPDLFIEKSNVAENTHLSAKPVVIKRVVSHYQAPYDLHIPFEPRFTFMPFHERVEKPRLLGIIIHQFFDKITKYGFDWWEKKSQVEQNKLIQLQLQQFSFDAKELPTAIEFISNSLQNSLTDRIGRWILSPHQAAQAEFAISTVIKNRVEKFVIDRTFIDENNIRWIIDYKTATIDLLDLAATTKKYRAQLEKYSIALQAIDDRPIRLGLYFPTIPHWICLEETAVAV